MKAIFAISRYVLALGLLSLGLALPVHAQEPKPFSKEQLDQMTAQIALYPDSLLSQLLMATTYPDEFAKAYQWSKAHPDAKGDEAVRMVEKEDWDPSVASMVGFPEVLDHAGREARLGEEHGRRVPGAARGCHGLGTAAARSGGEGGQSQVQRAGQGVEGTRAAARAATDDDYRATGAAVRK